MFEPRICRGVDPRLFQNTYDVSRIYYDYGFNLVYVHGPQCAGRFGRARPRGAVPLIRRLLRTALNYLSLRAMASRAEILQVRAIIRLRSDLVGLGLWEFPR